MATQMERGVPLSTLCPKFLHSNSTSHTWPFSAIAELIDNAYDPDVNAKQLWIDKTQIKGQQCLSFMDNGNGLNYEKMHKMLSFGYSEKTAVNGFEPIGIYGNGFKSGSMRLGQDAIVFSKAKDASCIGMLSQSYLKEIAAEQIIVPIVSYQLCVKEQHKVSLQDILRYSPFNTEAELLTELNTINFTGATGTRIIIWNLRRTSSGTTEFDFLKDRYDIRIPTDVYEALCEKNEGQQNFTSSIPESESSLRAYCSILYLKPRMQIVIRGVKVKTQLITKSLAHIAKDHYKPNFLNKRVPITFGFNTKDKEQYGIMMYHKNRLIKAYERVGCQLKANIKGLGVIGVIECNFLDPTHNKQNFNNTDDKYRKTIYNLGIKLEEYWNEMCYKRNKADPNNAIMVDMKRPDQNWVQCDDCLRWRKLPDGIDCSLLPGKWFCRLNPDPQFRSCQVEEEPEDSDDDQPSYRKTYKQHEREEQKKQETTKKMLEEVRKRKEEQRIADLDRQNKTLRQQHEDLKRQLKKKNNPETASSVENSPQSSVSTPIIPIDDDDDDDDDDITDDDDIVILETASTPVPKKPGLAKVKVERRPSDPSVGMVLDKASETNTAGTSSTETAAVGTGPSPPHPPEQTSSTTQTEVHAVKDEIKTEGEERTVQNIPQVKGNKQSSDVGTNVEQRVVKLESTGDAQTHSVNQRKQHNGETASCQLDTNEAAGPSHADPQVSTSKYPSMSEVQEQQQQQQDKLLELMHATAQERDSFKEKVDQLTSQLRNMVNRLQEVSQTAVKRECAHQASQTEEAQVEHDYKHLYEQAKQEVDVLSKEKEALLAVSQANCNSIAQCVEKLSDEIDSLNLARDQINKEKDELLSQVKRLQEEKAELSSQCEELKSNLQRTHTGGPSATHSGSVVEFVHICVLSLSLVELRHNVGRLLVPFVPALDLDQVNYKCNVLDEILEQVVCDVDTMGIIGQRAGAGNE
ncbi:MORC family CW-type zinc finger protein 3a [Diretmus argenteus]